MANPFQLSGFSSGELNARKNMTPNNDWYARRSPWVQVESFCSACGSSGLLKSLKEANPYESSTNRPKPIVTSVEVKQQGNLGTTRQATFKIIAFTKDQYQDIVNCYGVPGMTVRVQFGWSIGAAGQSPSVITGAQPDNAAICAINGNAASGVSDGLQGAVAKYAITFLKEIMAWEMTVTMIAASTPILGRQVQNLDSGNTCNCEVTSTSVNSSGEQVEEKQNTTVSLLKAKILEPIKQANPGLFGSRASIPGIYYVHLYNAERDENGNQAGGFVNTIANNMPFNTPESDEAYIQYGVLESIVNKTALPKDGPKIDSSKLGLLSFKSPGYSADPHICLFPGLDSERSGAGGTGYAGINSAPSCAQGGGIDVTKILVNCIFVNKCLTDIGKQGTIGDFFDKILQGINQAACGIFELSILDSGTCGSEATLSVIDLHKAEGATSGYSVSIGPNSAVARDIKLDLELTEAMATQAIYGSPGATSAPCDMNRFTTLYENVSDSANGSRHTSKPQGDSCPDTCDGETLSLEQAYTNMVYEDGITDASKESVRSKLIEQYNKNASKDVCKQVMLPWKFSFTSDGVGGFKFGQVVTTDILPSAASGLIFQVTSVEHSVTHADWTTTVNTIGRYKS